MKFLDSGSPPAFAGVARNDDFPLLSRVLLESYRIEFFLFSLRKQEINPYKWGISKRRSMMKRWFVYVMVVLFSLSVGVVAMAQDKPAAQ